MKKNEEYIVECLDLTRLGYGVVKIDDRIVFVSNLLPEEKALVKIIKVNKTYAIGKVIERFTQSKHRIQPKCSIFPSCGGCQLQHMDYEMQLKTKQAQVQASLWTNVEKLWWHSPIKYMDQCTTPTLFIHANEDYRCPYSEGLQMVSSLMQRGVEARLVMFKQENHELSRSGKPKHRIKRLEEITQWMESHLK